MFSDRLPFGMNQQMPDGDEGDMMARRTPDMTGMINSPGAKPPLGNMPQMHQGSAQAPNLPGQLDTSMDSLPMGKSMSQMGVQANPAPQQPGFWQKFGGGLGQLLSGGVQGAMQGWKGTQPGMQAPPPPGQTPMWQKMLGSGLGGM